MKKIVSFALCLTLLTGCTGQLCRWGEPKNMSKVNMIPRPLYAERSEGQFRISLATQIIVDSPGPDALHIANMLAERFLTAAGLTLKVKRTADNGSRADAIVFRIDPEATNLGSEGYTLTITQERITISALKPNGLFYGMQSLLQLLPAEIYAGEKMSQPVDWVVPCVQINDRPRYSWRGMHLDVCRHFYPPDFIKKYIDYLAMHKMNVFHWHLTEDQGWRIEIKRYPKLTEIGAWRADRPGVTWNECAPQQPGEPCTYGGFYTQDEVKEIIQYAKERFITVVPEIEMPGHSRAALAAYPELSCTGGPFTVVTGGYWPITDIYCAGKDTTFKFLENVLAEVVELFPGEFIHIGGDEANKANWEKCPHCQQRIKDEGLKDEHELQSYFIRRIEKFLNAKGKRLIGWDEILEGGLAPNATVMSWRGTEGGIAAAKAHHDVVMSPTSHCYFDYYQGDPAYEPEAIGGYLPLHKVYSFEPTPSELNEEEQKYVLGAQGNVWTEYIPTPADVEYMALPRMCALAEVVWTSKELKNYDDFEFRMGKQYLRLDAMGANYREPDLRGFRRHNVFMDKIKIELDTPIPEGKIHYTLDGSDPTASSSLYQKPIVLTESAELKVCVVLPNGRAMKVQKAVFEKQSPQPAAEVMVSQPGLQFHYMPLDSQITTVTAIGGLEASQRGTVSGFQFPDMEYPEYFGLRFAGFIKVPETGVYTFAIQSNDGSRLYIGRQLIVDNDGLHGPVTRSGQIALKKGLHPIRLDYFQGGANKKLTVFYEPPGEKRQEIPTDILFSQNGVS